MGSAQPGQNTVRLNFELTTACDHRCAHCYNVWGGGPSPADYDRRALDTPTTKALLTKAIRESGAGFVVLTGGEPLLRPDALELVEHSCGLAPVVLLVTNGSHLDTEGVARLRRARVGGVQLTFLSAELERHDQLKGRTCFEDTVAAARALRTSGIHVQICFVATRDSAPELAGVLELCRALGVDDLVYNRMAPSGGAVAQVAHLVPTPAQVEANLDLAERLGSQLQVRVSTAMPIPPCLIRIERYRHVRFGFCSTATATPNVVIDPLGNVRACNLASEVLGNVLETTWAEIMRAPYWQRFARQLPLMCHGCAYAGSCVGGCKESARAVFGRHDHPEPFVHFALDPTARDEPAPALGGAPPRSATEA